MIKYADPAKSKEWRDLMLNSIFLNFGQGITYFKSPCIEASLTDPTKYVKYE